jgi:ABC-type molybdate transport system substrate-binding protein
MEKIVKKIISLAAIAFLILISTISMTACSKEESVTLNISAAAS